METYGKILLIAMPSFLLLVLFEKWYGWRKGVDTVRGMDMISSLSSGVTNVTKDVLGLSISILSYEWMANNLAIFHIHSTIATYIIAFVALDFMGYWIHRLDHRVNIFWNAHIIHHSSEEFNLACALRQSISVFIRLFTFFLLPAAILGVPVEVIEVVAPIQLFAQFWYHTRHINKMGFLEKILVTPSHHRVHHAINPEYLDKNLSQIFIVWDKMFGTFQEELPDKPPVYGITRPAQTWNPIKINFQHFWLLTKDAIRTKQWKDKFRVWFMPTGWRPADVAKKYPVHKIQDVYNFEKYNPAYSNFLYAWSWIQLTTTLLLVSYLFYDIAKIGIPHIFIYGGFIFLLIYAFTELMDRNPYALVWELLKNIMGIAIILYLGDWFGASSYIPWISTILIVWFALSAIICTWIVFVHFKKQNVKTTLAQPA